MATGSILSGATFPTHDEVILGAEGLLGQGLVTPRTTETLFMPEAASVGELLVKKERGQQRTAGNVRLNLFFFKKKKKRQIQD